MADYTVSDAGTTAVNGDYTDNGGARNGQPVYENADGWYLFYVHDYWPGDDRWIIDEALVDFVADARGFSAYYSDTTGNTDPTAGDWSVGTGDSPAPTVEAASSGGSDTNDLGGSLTVLQQDTNDIGVSIIVYNYTPNTSPRPGNTRTNLSPSSNANMDFNGSPKSHPSNSQSPFNG